MYLRHEQALILAGSAHVEVSVASLAKDVWGQGSTANLLVGLAVLSGVFAEGVIAVAVSGGCIWVDGDEDGVGEGSVRQARVESIAEDGKDGVGSDVGKLRELGNLLRRWVRHDVG